MDDGRGLQPHSRCDYAHVEVRSYPQDLDREVADDHLAVDGHLDIHVALVCAGRVERRLQLGYGTEWLTRFRHHGPHLDAILSVQLDLLEVHGGPDEPRVLHDLVDLGHQNMERGRLPSGDVLVPAHGYAPGRVRHVHQIEEPPDVERSIVGPQVRVCPRIEVRLPRFRQHLGAQKGPNHQDQDNRDGYYDAQSVRHPLPGLRLFLLGFILLDPLLPGLERLPTGSGRRRRRPGGFLVARRWRFLRRHLVTHPAIAMRSWTNQDFGSRTCQGTRADERLPLEPLVFATHTATLLYRTIHSGIPSPLAGQFLSKETAPVIG